MPFAADGRSPWELGAPPRPGVDGSTRRAWGQVAVAFAGLTVVAAQLPGPRATLATLVGAGPTTAGGGIADGAMLVVAAVAVWLLLAWVVLISTVAVAGRLPGAVGSWARSALAAVAPVAIRNVLLTVVGASMVTGLAGCATVATDPAVAPAGAAATGAAATGAAATGAAATGSSTTASTATSSTASVPATAASSTAAPTDHASTNSASTSPQSTVSATGPASKNSASTAVTGGPSATAAGTVAQLFAERLIGVATLRISDRIAVEGSAVRSAGDAPDDSGPVASGPVMPGLDWPTAIAPSASSASSAGSPASTGRGSTAPPVSVDWPGPATRGHPAGDSSVVVLRGDSLWSIAARTLPAGADDATIDRTWRAWFAANSSVIGSDPNYLLPGQILQPPTAGTAAP